MSLNILAHLKSKKMTQAALAEAVGVSPGFISEVISGKKRFSLETLEKVAEVLNLSVGDLYDDAAAKPVDAAPRGFREDLTPFEPGRHDAGQHLDRLARALLPAGGRLALARLSRSAPGLAAMTGDIICLDTATRSVTGQTLACQVVDEMTASARTMFALAAPGGPIALPGEVPAKNGERVTTVGAVVGLMRGMS